MPGSSGLSTAATTLRLCFGAEASPTPKDRLCSPALRRIGFSRGARARVYAYSDDVYILVCDSVVVQKARERYEKVTQVRVNGNKSSGLRLGSWKGVAIPSPFS